MSNTIELNLLAKDNASRVVDGVSGAVRGLIGQFAALAGMTAGAAGLGGLIRQGIEFNKTMEDSRSGIAALVLANNTMTDSFGKALGPAQSLSQSFKVASGVQAELRQAAMTTAASYQDLVKAFQVAYGPATAAGITSISKVREVVVSASQAVAALGLDSRQTGQEIRALLQGEMGPDNMLANVLKITKDELTRLRASGEDVGDFFLKKLKPFADAAGASLSNFSTVVSNLGDALDQISGEAFAPLFREIKAQASGLGGAAGGLSGGLGAIGQGLAEGLRAVGPLIQQVAALGVAAAKAGTDFLAAFAPLVPALTEIVRVVAGLTDFIGTNAIAVWASIKAFQAFGPAAVTAAQGLSLFFARMQLVSGAENAAGLARLGAAFATLGASVTAAQLAIAAVPAAIAAVVLAGLKLKAMSEESAADEAWKRAAETQTTYIAVLERKYKVQVEANAAEQLLNVSAKERAEVMERVLKADKDGVVTADEVKSAMAAMADETMRATAAAAAFAAKQKETKEKYDELLASLRAEVKIGGLEGLKKSLAEVAEEFRKRRDQILKEFFDAGTGQWAQDPDALLKLLGISERQQIQEKAREFAKAFKAVPEEISGAWTGEMKKVEQVIDYTFTAAMETGEAAVEEMVGAVRKVREEWSRDIRQLLEAHSDAAAGVEAGWKMVLSSLPTAAESAASAIKAVWDSMRRGFDDLFGSVFTGRLNDVGRVFQNFADSMANTFAALVSDMVQRWLAGQQTIAEGWAELNKSMQTSSGNLSVEGGLMAAGTGYGIGSMVGQGTQANQIGAAAGAVIGAIVLSAIPVVGTILGAIVGGLIGELFNKNTEKKFTDSLGGMVGATAYVSTPIYEPRPRGAGLGMGRFGNLNPDGNEEPYDPGAPIGTETYAWLQTPQTAFERQGQKVFEAQSATFADIFRVGAKDQAQQLIDAYQKSLREMLSGAWVTIAAGSQEDIEKDAEYVIKGLLPRIGLSAAFGQTGYLPHGNRDNPNGMPGIDWGMPGMDEAGNWTGAKQLFDPEAPIPKMLAGLGFTNERIEELAGRISTDDPAKLLAYIQGIVGVVVGLRDLGKEMGETFDELVKGWKEEAAAGPAAAFGKAAQDLAGRFDDLSLYSGDEQLQKAQEAQAAAAQFWESVKSYLQQLQALAEKLSAGLQGMREKMRAFLDPLSESGQIAADQEIVDSTWGKLLNAKTPAEVERATNEAAAAIERMFSILSERVTRGKALLERTNDLIGKLGNLREDVAFGELLKTDPLKAWGKQMIDMQGQIAKAAKMSGLAQIRALEEVNASAEEMYQNIQAFLTDIASTSKSINSSIDSQIWELGVNEMDPQGQAGAIGQRIQELQEQIKLATSPAEIAALSAEIQGLTNRYVGTFDKDDPNRQAAIDWATEQLKRTQGIANDALDALREDAEAFATELETMLRTSTTALTTNIDDATTAIGQLSHTLGALDTAVQEAIRRLGQNALDALAPLREAMDGAAEIFKGATTTAGNALTAPESGFTAATERSTARLNIFADALDRAIGKLNGLASGDSTAPPATQESFVEKSSGSRTSSAEIVSAVRRYGGQLRTRVA